MKKKNEWGIRNYLLLVRQQQISTWKKWMIHWKDQLKCSIATGLDEHAWEDIQEDVEERQRELDAILATKLSWSRNVALPVQPDKVPPSSASQAVNEEDGHLATTAFPLFGTNNHVRLLSPSLIYTGPGRGRILWFYSLSL